MKRKAPKIKLLSFLLCVCMLAGMLPSFAFSQAAPEAEHNALPGGERVTESSLSQDANVSQSAAISAAIGVIVEEDLSKREEYTKHFLCDDGTYIAVSYPDPVHMQNEAGEWLDIAFPLTAQNGRIAPEDDETDISLADTANGEDSSLVRFAADGHQISWTVEAVFADADNSGSITPPSADDDLPDSGIIPDDELPDDSGIIPDDELPDDSTISGGNISPDNGTIPDTSNVIPAGEDSGDSKKTALEEQPAVYAEGSDDNTNQSRRLSVSDAAVKSTSDILAQNKNAELETKLAALLSEKQAAAESAEALEEINSRIKEFNDKTIRGASFAQAIVEYPDAFDDGTTLRYSLSPGQIKEEIVIGETSGFESYSMLVCANGLTAEVCENGSVEMSDETGEAVIIITSPYMYDANHSISDDITVTLEQSESECIIIYTPASDWLNDEERAWPVTIDPTTQGVAQSSQLDTYVSPSINGSSVSSDPYIKIGYPNGENYPQWGYWRIAQNQMPSIPSGSTVTSAAFYARLDGGTGTMGHTALHASGNTWDSSTITWNNRPSYGAHYGTVDTVPSNKWVSYTIPTATVQGWYSGSVANYGFILKYTHTPSGCWNGRCNDFNWFYSSDYRPSGSTAYIPYISFTYTSSSQYSTDLANGIYFIRTPLNGKYLDRNTSNNETDVLSFSGAADQQWRAQLNSDGTYCFYSVQNQVYRLEVYCGLDESERPVTQAQYPQENAARFYLIRHPNGSYSLRPKICANRVVDIYGGTNKTVTFSGRSFSKVNGQSVQIFTFNSVGNNQKWFFEAATTTGGVKEIRTTTSQSINCLAYAFFLNSDTFQGYYLTNDDVYYCEQSSANGALARTKQKMMYWLNAVFPGKWREVPAYNSVINSEREWLVCMRVGVGFYRFEQPHFDYHFWYRTNTGAWYNKHGPSGWSEQVSGNIVNPSTANTSDGWALYGEYYYTSSTVYYAISE